MQWLLDPNHADDLQHAVAWILAVGLLGAAAFGRHPRLQSMAVRRAAVAAVVLCGLLAGWANFFLARNNGAWIHRWDLFHTVIGAKYFPELGYDHLYDCAYVLAKREQPTAFHRVDKIRDLGTLKYVKAEKVLETSDCAQRFTPERARAFVADVHAFGELGLKKRWHEAFKDKGYNGTPFYTLVARSVVNDLPIEYGPMLGIALIDIALVLGALVVLGLTRGWPTAFLALAILATCFPGRFVHMGGSFLRFDYLAALIVGLCALASKRPAIAGALLAYATLIRVFPAFFVLGVLIVYAAQAFEARKLPADAVRFCAGGLIATLVLGGATFVWADGARDWALWWAELQSHTRYSAAFRVGFKHMFMLDGNLTGDEGFVQYPDKAAHFQDRRVFYYLAALALLAPLVARARRWDAVTFSALFGVTAFFIALIATRYYYAVLVVPLLADPRTLGERTYLVMAGLLSLAAAVTYAIAGVNEHAAFLNNTVVTTGLTLLATTLAAYCAWQLRAQKRHTDLTAEAVRSAADA